jgi:site-specific recombinase XerD
MVELTEITLIPDPSRKILNPRELVDYEAHRKECLSWLLAIGKNPPQADGYALSTVKTRAYRMDMFYRWVWSENKGYTTSVTIGHADGWMKDLAYGDTSNVHKNNCRKAVKMLFKWREYEKGAEGWEPQLTFSSTSSTNPRDYLTKDERTSIREAALKYGSIPAYGDLSPSERDRWKAYLSQRFMKPKTEVSPSDWDRANGWKIPSLVWASLDAGLRPVEVERATVRWVDVENEVLRIPKEESSKNRDNWIVGVTQRTAEALERWIEERENYKKYNGTDKLWLTREANPYTAQSLRYLLKKLCEEAGIPTENRKMSWYAIRHSVGTYMTREEDLAATQAQLRHKSKKTTMRYDQVPVEDRRDALNRMG